MKCGGWNSGSPRSRVRSFVYAPPMKPTRELPVPLSRRARFAAKLLQPAPAASGFHRFASEYFDWNDPPFFKQFLRVDVADDGLTVRCFGVTGCRDAVTEPPVEDSFSVRF